MIGREQVGFLRTIEKVQAGSIASDFVKMIQIGSGVWNIAMAGVCVEQK